MKKILLVAIFLLLVIFPANVNAQIIPSDDYVITNFDSEIKIEKNTDLLVKETLEVNFPYPKHGIFRIIPIIYSANGKTIKADFDLVSITDELGNYYLYEKSRLGQSIKLKIGDPNMLISGPQTYVIKYHLSDVLQRYDDSDELYWNVTGSEWDTEILSTTAIVRSDYAEISKTDCFAGTVRSSQKSCTTNASTNEAAFVSDTQLGPGKDFTIVVGLNKNNQLEFPGFTERIIDFISDNWGYLPALVPLSLMFYFWYKKGRDTRYVSENIYFKPKNVAIKTVSLFERRHIPFVYHPINNLSPSEVGTIIDERVHISDVVSEILELTRLGFIQIQRIEKKKLFGKENEYAFIKTDKYKDMDDRTKLKNYQDFLLKEIFKPSLIVKSKSEEQKLLNKVQDKNIANLLSANDYVLLSKLKNNFYKSLPIFKDKLYKRMKEQEMFADDPEKTRLKWIGIFIAIDMLFGFIAMTFMITTLNIGPVIFLIVGSVAGIIFALQMPRRTAKGYSYFRQIEGLKYYLKVGKWRHEVNEKHLFIEEILPLAVALGVVDIITADMQELGVKPPSYFAGSNISTFSSDFSAFNLASASSLMSSPQSSHWSGKSSWSGGSGFSSGGGFSGGGFGGGGGGSW